jgi:hypothetical protein
MPQAAQAFQVPQAPQVPQTLHKLQMFSIKVFTVLKFWVGERKWVVG